MTEITGTEADDVLDGGAGDDLIVGLGGADTLSGGDGDDVLNGDGGPAPAPSPLTRISVPGVGGQADADSGASFVSPDGSSVVFWSTADNLAGSTTGWGLFHLNVASGAITRVDDPSGGGQIVFSPDGSRVAYRGADGQPRVIDLETTEVVEDITAPATIDGRPFFSSDGLSNIALAGNTVREWAVAAGGPSNSLTVNVGRELVATDIALSPDGQKLAVMLVTGEGSDGDEYIDEWIIRIHDRATGTPVEVGRGRNQAGDLQSMAFSHDGHSLVWTAGANLTIYDIASETSRTILTETAGQQFKVWQFMPGDQTLILTATSGGVSEIWGVDIATGAVTVLAQGTNPSVAADGTFITFTTTAALSSGDTNNRADVYLLDLTWSGSSPEYSDTLNGGAGNDVLNGGPGADVMIGGLGDDVFYVDNVGDVVQEGAVEGQDTVRSSVTFSLEGTNVEVLELTGGAAIDATGTSGADTLIGNNADNVLNGMGGADILRGGRGDDTYIIDDLSVDQVVELANEGRDTIVIGVSVSLEATPNIENVTLTGSDDLNATGNDAANILRGNAGNNILTGKSSGAADMLIGGDGDDTYVVGNGADTVIELDGEGYDTVYATAGYTLSAHVEVLILLGRAVYGTGNAGANIIIGNDNNNQLSGQGGGDIMIGGLGNDTYRVSSADDQVIELAGEGNDAVIASVSYALAADTYVQTLTLSGSNAIWATGNRFANTLNGNTLANTLDGGAGNDVLNGGAGADRMIGGKGDDTFYVDNGGDMLVEAKGEGADTVSASVHYTLQAGSYVETLRLTGFGNLNGTGNGIANTLIGNIGVNILNGGKGDDILDGGQGADTLIGGAGDDTFYVDNVGDVLVEAKGEGDDTVSASVHYTLQAGSYVETLVLTGGANLNATGNGASNTLRGNAGNNVLNGGAANDTLIGGKGDDTYHVGSNKDVVTENDGEGTDLILASASFVMKAGSYVENLTLAGTANINGTGNGIANIITGNAGKNKIDGGKGSDILYGGAGNDTLNGGVSGADQMHGGLGDDLFHVNSSGDKAYEAKGEGTDWVYSSVSYSLNNQYIDYLTLTGSADIYAKGNSLDNRLVGNSGDNRINGMSGQDRLSGGAGSDTFIWDATSHSKVSKADQITDLSNADFIDLSRIDANVNVAGTQHFVLVDAFTNTAGQVTLTFDGAYTRLNADTNGDGVSDMLIRIDGDHTDFDNFIFGGG